LAETVIQPPEQFAKSARIGELKKYRALYDRSISDSDGFWAEQAGRLSWFKKWDKVSRWDFNSAKIEWFVGGKLNASYNCLDRHVSGPRKNKAALVWEGDSPDESRILTYQELHREVCKFANALKKLGTKRGDRVTIYLPMVPELPIAMLACARIGAIHSVVFGGFSAESLKNRIQDCGSELVITADGGFRGAKLIPLKATTDAAVAECPTVRQVVVLKRTGKEVPFTRAATGGGTTWCAASRSSASPRRWTPRTRSSSSIRAAPPESPRACCTPRADTWSTPRSPTRRSSISAKRTPTGAPPTSAG
jgi:acetyl-CoA synthetase